MNNPVFFQQEVAVLIRDRQAVLFEGKAAALTTKNENGVLDILPQHTQFISIIKEFLALTRKDGTVQRFEIDTGIIKVYENQIKVYLGIFSAINAKKK